MLFLILLLLISIPLVSPSYHIPKLGRYHTFLRIGKRQFNEPCIEPSLCQPRVETKCVRYFHRNLCWLQIHDEQTTTTTTSTKPSQYHHYRFSRDNT